MEFIPGIQKQTFLIVPKKQNKTKTYLKPLRSNKIYTESLCNDERNQSSK